MKNRLFSAIALILAMILLLSALAGCNDETETSQQTQESESTEITTEAPTNNETASETEIEDESESETADQGETNEPLLDGEHALLIENATALANKVQAYFTTPDRTHFTVENTEMKLTYSVDALADKQVSSLTNKEGHPYLTDTMDVFVKTTDGNVYYASTSSNNAKTNIFRLGYYFYETRFETQDFCGTLDVKSEKVIKHLSTKQMKQIKVVSKENSILTLELTGTTDPFIFFDGINYPADKYQYLELTIRADQKAEASCQLFLTAGSQQQYNSKQSLSFAINTDGEFHTYRLPLYNIYDYTGTLSDIRIDFSGALGATFEISELKLLSVDLDDLPYSLGLNRSFMTYSDKMHQVIQIATTKTVNNIAGVGMKTEIDVSTVDKVVAADKNGIHYSFDEVDWTTVEYVGFDIKDAGIFGYILPYDNKSGTIEVTEENGKYVIIQTAVPENYTIEPSVRGMKNANDFYIGQRIYTDANHTFDEFLHEAYCERNPLKDTFIQVSENYVNAKYSGYDALRGIYTFSVSGGAFNDSYYNYPQKHYNVDFSIKGDSLDRKIYVMTETQSGCLECAALLDESQLMIPIPLEVGKNFSETNGERNIYNQDDAEYGEVIFPMVIESRSRNEYTVVNLYQMWGKYPLKQISWIQYGAPYYHLSTGVTETNCIRPYYATKNGRSSLTLLPDFRGMSAPFWTDQPQHNSCGTHLFVYYTDSNGKSVQSELKYQNVGSYGPIYADYTSEYLSDDGKMKITLNHMEMPQTDENRTFYEIRCEVLDDVSISSFAKDFSFYTARSSDPTGIYQQVGYLDENNECKVVDAVAKGGETVQYTLGNASPYFSFFNMDNATSDSQQGYSNLAFLVYNSEFVVGGENVSPNFVLVNSPEQLSISLDLGEVTLKKGDKLSINAILLPWGSQESIYDGSNGKAPDQNVRDVRENTLLNPLTATADGDCEVIESVYLPKLKTTNGKSAEFTLSGGENNVAVRIYGFDKLTSPKIEEKVDGEWVEYEVCSAKTPDAKGYAHYYDGYGVYYDGDGTFSYAFIVTMTDGAPRSFRIKADETFVSYPYLEQPKGSANLLDLYIDANTLNEKIDPDFISKSEVLNENGTEFVRFYGTGDEGKYAEAYVHAYRADTDKVTGHYLVIKYRYPTTNTKQVSRLCIFTSTTTISAAEGHRLKITAFDQDGEWHTLVIDMTKSGNAYYIPDENGNYSAKYFRFVFFDKRMPTDDYIDIAYMGIDDSLDEILKLNEDTEKITLLEDTNEYFVFTETGEKINAIPIPDEGLILPSSPLTPSTLKYSAYFDGINGIALGTGGNSTKGAHVFKYKKTAIADVNVENYLNTPGAYLVFSGWAAVEGGIEKYVWSADNGLTWHDAVIFGNNNKVSDASAAILTAAGKAISHEFTEADKANGAFYGHSTTAPKGLCANLSEYSGSDVNVIFGAVPAAEGNTVCPFVYVVGVKVP